MACSRIGHNPLQEPMVALFIDIWVLSQHKDGPKTVLSYDVNAYAGKTAP